MKVQTSIRGRFNQQQEVNTLLKEHVDKLFMSAKDRRWHYESRLKELESFAVKVETGRVKDPSRLEDFLACTLVVPKPSEVQAAAELVGTHFKINEKRPDDVAITKKSAHAFPFDDLRIYCYRENDGTRPPDRTDNVIFEIQIKTFLQHAWGIATHDLSYKTDEVRWGKDRLVAHLKASIEYAELAIHETEMLSQSGMLALSHAPTNAIIDIIQVLKAHWPRNELPANLRSLAQTVNEILSILEMNAADLEVMLSSRSLKTGGLPLNLSPYATILETIIVENETKFLKALKKARVKIVVTPEMSLPAGFPLPSVASKIVVI
jgi:hypothetical protein